MAMAVTAVIIMVATLVDMAIHYTRRAVVVVEAMDTDSHTVAVILEAATLEAVTLEAVTLEAVTLEAVKLLEL